MQTLRVEELSKTYGEKTLFKNLNFMINEHDRIGLIGTNGSGKTSLLNVLTGVDSPDSGQLITPHDYRISYLKQTPELDEQATIITAVFEGAAPVFQTIRNYEEALQEYGENPEDQKVQQRYVRAEENMNRENAWSAESDVKTILSQLHLTQLEQKVGTLSGGQKKRVGLAQVLIQAPDLLVLDEPTNHLDFDSINWLQDYLAAYQGALLVVTHDRYFLDQVATQIMELSFGKLYTYPGNYQDFVEQKAKRVTLEEEAAHKQQQLYKKELAWMHTGAKARTTKQQARINSFNELKRDLHEPQQEGQVDISLKQQRLGKKVIEIKNGTLKVAQHQIIKDFNLLVQANSRIGITGANGAGKTSFLNVCAGLLPLDSGVIELGQTVKLAYYKQQMEPIPGDQRMISYLNDYAQNVVDRFGQHISTTQLLEQFLFPRFMHGILIRKLSGGEKRRLYLLKLLMSSPNVLLLDEPTNDLDIATLTVLEDYLATFNGAVITVSHDRYFLDKVAQQLLIFSGKGKIEQYTGRFSNYLQEHQDFEKHQSVNKKEQPTQQKELHASQKKTKLTYAEKIELKAIEEVIDRLEQEKQQLVQQMAALPGSNYTQLGDLQRQVEQADQKIEAKMNRWDYLSQFEE
ncbi:ABC-F family ATP-binding cassette domain-containing protein [Liquorilactobacillus satsumensis]|uniref:ABC transporter, ATP-binding protein n=2 Tax=Liquorilactobacillus satsumensis TaxID=259059 RepID=A0A0R1V1G7_9LACO|nr:ABC-F family ATP-binding cassette domain-containing protein [Liquorilactobacillus satsumensis]KRL99497.1 ABC transporter, ATP-binding protein [Liquorilactobacillus satsumensis DSM 16230 = JCM 12392]MCP9327847.1 ABC-F family ATP-binding cassette domain-containing protein [Liquorilactobacillus satsumensis]